MGLMAKKPDTTPVPVRLPTDLLPDFDKAAEEDYESRSGLLARVLIEWIRKWKASKAKGKGKDKG